MENELSQLLKVRREKLKELADCGRNPFIITKFDGQVHAQDIKDNYADFDGKTVTVAGRVMSKRRMGKIGFAHLQDLTGRIQLVVKKDTLGEEEYEFFKEYRKVHRTSPDQGMDGSRSERKYCAGFQILGNRQERKKSWR